MPRQVAEAYVGFLRDRATTVILGCTHYPLLTDVLGEVLPGARLVDSAHATARAVSAVLGAGEGSGGVEFLVTDHVERFQHVGAHFLGTVPSPVRWVDLGPAVPPSRPRSGRRPAATRRDVRIGRWRSPAHLAHGRHPHRARPLQQRPARWCLARRAGRGACAGPVRRPRHPGAGHRPGRDHLGGRDRHRGARGGRPAGHGGPARRPLRLDDPEAYRDLQRETHGAYTGLGVEVRLTDEGPRVTRVLPGSPASRDGITVGDLILEVDGQRLEASEMEEVNRALLGPRGQPARLQVRRAGDGSDHTIQTVRDRVEAPNVDVDALAPGIAYARMVQFREGAAADLERQLARHVAEGPVEALVLDLRDNPGGLLTEAVATADLFLSEGPIVSTTGRVEGERRAFEATPDSLGVPVVVLVNGRSASAAEIVAAALQDTRAGRLVGTRTYGKGSIQTVFEHRDGSALKLTVGRYLTPSGTPVAPATVACPTW
ncbi:MAG: PDZ domain-containing protein [Alphaproteobacteria bacterium]|nr:PDZ domain-containing protein [Alphaproteobacteria bacterium]